MKRILLFSIALLMLGAVLASCEKEDKSYGSVKTTGDNEDYPTANFELKSAGYYYSEGSDAYDLVFLAQKKTINAEIREEPTCGYLVIDIDGAFLNAKRDLSSSLDSDDWSFYAYTPGSLDWAYIITSGSFYLSFDKAKKTVELSLEGKNSDGSYSIKAKYNGPISQSKEDYLYGW